LLLVGVAAHTVGQPTAQVLAVQGRVGPEVAATQTQVVQRAQVLLVKVIPVEHLLLHHLVALVALLQVAAVEPVKLVIINQQILYLLCPLQLKLVVMVLLYLGHLHHMVHLDPHLVDILVGAVAVAAHLAVVHTY
jgi:hypothetical protein